MIKEDLELLKFNKLVDDSNEILFNYLSDKNPYCLQISNVYEEANQEIINTLVNSYSEDIYSSMLKAINDPRVISYLRQELSNSSYTFDIDKFFKIVFNEYIKLSTEFKQKKGLDIAIEYVYNMVMSSGLQPTVGGSDVPFELTWGSAGNPNEPFSFQVRGFLLPFIYDNVVKEMAHPVGFGYLYQRSLKLNFIDYVNDNTFNVFTTIQIKGIEQGQEVTYDFSQFLNHVIDYSFVTNQDGTTVETITFINNGEIQTIQKNADNHIVYSGKNGVIKDWDNSYTLIIKYTQKTDFRVLDSFSTKIKMNYFEVASSPNKKTNHRIGEPKLVVGNHWQINNSYKIKQIPNDIDSAFLKFFLSRNGENIPVNGRLVIDLNNQSFVTNKFIDGYMDYCQYDMFNHDDKLEKIAPYIIPQQSVGDGFGKWVVDGSNNVLFIDNKQAINLRSKKGLDVLKLFKENGRGTIYITIEDKNHKEEGLLFLLDNDIKLGVSYNPLTQKYSLKNYGGVGGIINIESDTSYANIEKRIAVVIGRNDTQVNNIDVKFYINETLIGYETLTQHNSEVNRININTTLTNSSFCDIKIKNLRVWEGVSLNLDQLNTIKSFDNNPIAYNNNISDINTYFDESSKRGLYQGVGENFSIKVKTKPRTIDDLRQACLNNRGNLKNIDTSLLNSFNGLFAVSPFDTWKNEDFNGIETWDTSNVNDIGDMFKNCINFNKNINNWNVSKVTYMSNLFYNCTNFNQPLNGWDVSKVVYMGNVFRNCTNFNQPLNSWDVSKVTNMGYMFNNSNSFNQNISNWNVENVTNFKNIFVGCPINLENKPPKFR